MEGASGESGGASPTGIMVRSRGRGTSRLRQSSEPQGQARSRALQARADAEAHPDTAEHQGVATAGCGSEISARQAARNSRTEQARLRALHSGIDDGQAR
eukprot:8800049-Alexandrium_andersonii.AAC.1